ncbi:hypothetical protein [Jannaschia formosa]|uniref:hypothetical protein n=1 Tax=Jannaschia formosa TaxID=2259592 RepID=UPI001FD7BBCF|nr:hypothetical protein [Jannaschia formosa]
MSHRLIARSGETPPDGWRLPATELEACVAGLIGDFLSASSFTAMLRPKASTAEVGQAASVLGSLAKDADPADRLSFIGRVDIAPGRLTLKLNPAAIATRFGIDPEDTPTGCLGSEHPFQLRKRGVETKIIRADTPAGRDAVLIRNVAQAHVWFERVKRGETYAQIAKNENLPAPRIQRMIGLGFLAPDLVADILNFKQPHGFTSEWCKTHDLPFDWAEQRALVRTL